MKYCRVCGKPDCRQHEALLKPLNIKSIKEFSGSSPPEIFVGRFNYPNVYAGILSPTEVGNTERLSSQELWHRHRLSIPQIQLLRNRLIYGRTRTNIRKAALNPEEENKRFVSSMKEIAMSSKSVSAEFKLKKPIEANKENETYVPIIKNSALIDSVKLQENPKIESKVDYLTNDTDAKAKTAVLELEKSNISITTIIKILSAGLIGVKPQRKLVPTRWSITAVDDMISNEKLKKIKYLNQIQDILVFTSDYLGNHYEFLLLPDSFSFEVLEINSSMPENCWQDHESFFKRKTYASNVTGAYYANRLALCEYLERINKRASCLVIREIGPEYTQSMGVGILRQISREAFTNQPQKFTTLQEALINIQSRLTIPLEKFTNKSIILKDFNKQTKLEKWF